MDSNQTGSIVLSFLEAFFPGGTRAFTEEGGVISAVPFDADTILIYHPSMPKSFTNKIDEHNTRNGIKFAIVSEINFNGMSPVDIMKQLYETGEAIREKYKIPVILYNPINPLVLTINIPLVTLSSDVIHDISQTFTSRVSGIERGCLIVGENMYPFSSGEMFEVSKHITPTISIEPERRAITPDDITDLRITLANDDLDVNDIINML